MNTYVKKIETRMGIKEIEFCNTKRFKDIPKTVYKYRVFNQKSIEIIVNKSVFVPSPREFNDPYDCKIPTNYEMLKDKEFAREYFLKVVNTLPELKHLSDEEKLRQVEIKINEDYYKNEAFIKKMQQSEIEKLNLKFGIYCVTPIKDNILMWSHYADSHKGFCIGFDSEKLFNLFGAGSEVKYVKDFSDISPLDETSIYYDKLLSYKYDIWDYEVEYRLRTFRVNTFHKLNENCIKEIIIGHSMPKKDSELLMSLTKKYLPRVELYQMKTDNRKFELITERIDF